jgi:hypothetical protein
LIEKEDQFEVDVRLRRRAVTITLPDAGKRFMSMQVIDEDQHTQRSATAPAANGVAGRDGHPLSIWRQAMCTISRTRCANIIQTDQMRVSMTTRTSAVTLGSIPTSLTFMGKDATFPVAVLRRRAASRGYCRIGQLGRADEAPRTVSCLSELAIEQLNVLPEFVAACGFANAKAPGFEADDLLTAAVAAEERRRLRIGGKWRSRFLSARLAKGRRSSTRRGAEKIARVRPEEVRQRYGVDPNHVADVIGSAVILLTNCPALLESGQNAPLNWCDGTARLRGSLRPVSFMLRLRSSASIG